MRPAALGPWQSNLRLSTEVRGHHFCKSSRRACDMPGGLSTGGSMGRQCGHSSNRLLLCLRPCDFTTQTVTVRTYVGTWCHDSYIGHIAFPNLTKAFISQSVRRLTFLQSRNTQLVHIRFLWLAGGYTGGAAARPLGAAG